MKFRSTKNKSLELSFSQAIQEGIAPDGGLYVPVAFPSISLAGSELPELASAVLRPFLDGDVLAPKLRDICEQVFNFPLPLKFIPDSSVAAVLELFHGPTAAFKDFGARFLSECLAHTPKSYLRTVLVATSGDTGGAVAAAFFKRPGFRVVILYPKGKVSARQEKQLTAWGENVRGIAVEGDFDDCQRLVKEAFRDEVLQKEHHFISANSINLGRLLPQMVYYVYAARKYLSEKAALASFVIPSGNLGNSVACFWARRCGAPIENIILATNANRAVPDFYSSTKWQPQPTVETLANAMDVGNPSNMERVFDMYSDTAKLFQRSSSISVTNDEISSTIVDVHKKSGLVLCPHTATAFAAAARIGKPNLIAVATAHPAKFESIVEPLVGVKVKVPPELEVLLKANSNPEEMKATLADLRNALALT